MKRIAFYGGTFDPIHIGHHEIAIKVKEAFDLDEFYFLPAFQSPLKNALPESSFHRYAMLALSTVDLQEIKVSSVELERLNKQYTFDTLEQLKALYTNAKIFFVMGADSWLSITKWHRWQDLLTSNNIIVISRPGFNLNDEYFDKSISSRIIDLTRNDVIFNADNCDGIFLSDIVNIDMSASKIRSMISEKIDGWQKFVPAEVAKYIEKYELYK